MVLQQARKFARNIHTAFNLKVTKQTKPIQFINHLLRRVGLSLKFHRQAAKGQRFYRIDVDKLNDLDRLAVLSSLSQKWAQLGSESQSWASQQKPIEINNTGICCDPKQAANASDEFIPDEYREGVLEVGTWLTQAACETPETLQDILDVAIEYLRLVPQAKVWLWRAMKAGIKDTIEQLFPDYYQALSTP